MLAEGELPHVKPLPIKGVDWPIPRVNPETHFTVDEFEHVIHETMVQPFRWYRFADYRHKQRTWTRRAWNSFFRWVEKHAMVYRFLWLDIACIDQRWTRTTMLEIGRQARIFSHAEQSYVWLSRLQESALRPSLLNLMSATYKLENEPWRKEEAIVFQSRPWLRMFIDSLTTLVKDPWFSSLWTLQEAFLCPQAILLSRDGEGVLDIAQVELQPWRLERLFVFVNDLVQWSERSRAPRAEPEFSELMTLIRQSGLAALWHNNPMSLLGVAYTRQTTKSLDRVYGIMQSLGSDFRVGLAKEDADPSREYTLSELEDEFGASLVTQYPVLSQMHVHLAAPEVGKGWCVRGNSVVPLIADRGELFGWADKNRIKFDDESSCDTLCDMSTLHFQGNLWAKLGGRACSFIKLQQAWRDANCSPFATRLLRSSWRMHRSTVPSVQMIALDRSTSFSPSDPDLSVLNVANLSDENRLDKLMNWIIGQPGIEDVRVFLLGRTSINNDFFYTGLLLIPCEIDGVTRWRRIGICMWMASHFLDKDDGLGEYQGRSFLTGANEDWQPFEGLFG